MCYLHLIHSGRASTSWPCGLGQASHSAQRVPNFQKGIMKTLQAAKDPPKAYMGGLCRAAHQMCRHRDVATVRGTRKPVGHASQPVYQRAGDARPRARTEVTTLSAMATPAWQRGRVQTPAPDPGPGCQWQGVITLGCRLPCSFQEHVRGTAMFLYRVGGFAGTRHSFLGAERIPQGGAPARNSS